MPAGVGAFVRACVCVGSGDKDDECSVVVCLFN